MFEIFIIGIVVLTLFIGLGTLALAIDVGPLPWLGLMTAVVILLLCALAPMNQSIETHEYTEIDNVGVYDSSTYVVVYRDEAGSTQVIHIPKSSMIVSMGNNTETKILVTRGQATSPMGFQFTEFSALLVAGNGAVA